MVVSQVDIATDLTMLYGILEAFLGELSFIAGSVPYQWQERMCRGDHGFVEYSSTTSAVHKLLKVRAVPGFRVQLVFQRVQVVWGALNLQSISVQIER